MSKVKLKPKSRSLIPVEVQVSALPGAPLIACASVATVHFLSFLGQTSLVDGGISYPDLINESDYGNEGAEHHRRHPPRDLAGNFAIFDPPVAHSGEL